MYPASMAMKSLLQKIPLCRELWVLAEIWFRPSAAIFIKPKVKWQLDCHPCRLLLKSNDLIIVDVIHS